MARSRSLLSNLLETFRAGGDVDLVRNQASRVTSMAVVIATSITIVGEREVPGVER